MNIRLGDTEIGLFRYLSLWTAVAVVFAVQHFLKDAITGPTWSASDYLRWGMIQWYTWAALAPLVFRLAQRYPIQAPLRLRGLGTQLVASVSITVLAMVAGALVSTLFEPSGFAEQLWMFLAQHFGRLKIHTVQRVKVKDDLVTPAVSLRVDDPPIADTAVRHQVLAPLREHIPFLLTLEQTQYSHSINP